MFFPENKKIELVKKLPQTKIYSNYGSTEYMRATFLEISENLSKANTEGKASRNTCIKISNIDFDKENSLIDDQKSFIGEILVKGAHLSRGYLNSDEWQKRLTSDGYFKTGDIGYLDKDGFLVHKGRKDNIFNFQGKLFSANSLQEQLEKKFPLLENKITLIPLRKENSIKDTEINLILSKSIKVQKENPSETEIKKFFLNYGLKISIIFLPCELPRTGNGKIAYGKLKKYIFSKNHSK